VRIDIEHQCSDIIVEINPITVQLVKTVIPIQLHCKPGSGGYLAGGKYGKNEVGKGG
jgi:hypothetical protein